MNEWIEKHDVETQRPPLRVAPRGQLDLELLDARVARAQLSFSYSVRREEGRCGLFAFIVTAAPRYASMIETLRAQHRDFAAALAALRIKIRRTGAVRSFDGAARREALHLEADALLAAIEEHEALEREILEDALDPP